LQYLKKVKTLLEHSLQYEALRNAIISHRQVNPKNPNAVIQKVNWYYPGGRKFEFTLTDEFDYNNSENVTLLKSEASNLKR
jgi:hypothetical protein